MRTRDTDALIIGTGFGGSAPALRLAAAGWRCLVLEKGPHVDARRDFRQTQDHTYLQRYLHNFHGRGLSVNHIEALGGASGFYEMVSLRAPSKAFDQVDEAGQALWPQGIDRATLDPFYDRAEEMLCVSQIEADRIPRTGLLFTKLMRNLGYSAERARYAARGCLGSGFCLTGCIYGAKQSLLLNYLPQAMAKGAQVLTEAEALQIEPLDPPVDGYRYRVVYRVGGTEGPQEACRARVVLCAGGTLGTAKLLLQSRDSLSNLSDQVGRNIAFNGSVKVAGLLAPDLPDLDLFAGQSHPGVISYQFLDSHGISIFPMKVLPLQMMTTARMEVPSADGDARWWGTEHAAVMRSARQRLMVLVAIGFSPPAGVLSRSPRGTFKLAVESSPALNDYAERARTVLNYILEANGCDLLPLTFINKKGRPHKHLHFSGGHSVGSARMAEDPEHGVVGADGQVFGHPGLYVTGGAAVPSSLAVNPSLTILANAERIAEGILAHGTGSATPDLERLHVSSHSSGGGHEGL